MLAKRFVDRPNAAVAMRFCEIKKQ
jgi:hypothetical protein